MIAYYESQADHPPAHLLPALVRAFGVSAGVLLGLEEHKRTGRPRDNRLWRRFSQVEKLPSSARKAVVQYLDTVLENQKFKSAVEHG
jgi:hypothetical protein